MKRHKVLILLLLTSSGLVWGGSHEAKGNEAFVNGKYQRAIAHYQRALDKQKASDQAEMNLLRAYLYQGRHDDTLKLMDRLDDKHAENAEYLIIQGDFYRRLNDWETAKIAYEKALLQDQSNAGLYLKMGQTLSVLGDDAAAEEAFDQFNILSGN